MDRASLLPVRAEILDADGTILLAGDLKLRRYEQVEVVGSPAAGPLIPTLIDIRGLEADAYAKLSIYSPTSDRREIDPNYFDLDWLMQSFPPQRVEGVPGPIASGASRVPAGGGPDMTVRDHARQRAGGRD